MVIKCYGDKHEYLLFIDIEFSKFDLVQFAGILFKRIDHEVYQTYRNINVYITQKVCYPFMEYTNLSNSFLEENGMPLSDAIALIQDDFLDGVPLSDLKVISHGLKNDRIVLTSNGINISNYTIVDEVTGKEIKKPVDGYCTYSNAKRILQRDKNLKLEDVAAEFGYHLNGAHNASCDVEAEVEVYTSLRLVEYDEALRSKNDAAGE